MREIYRMFQGKLSPADVLAADRSTSQGQFFAQLYVGLYYEAMGNTVLARKHLAAATVERFAAAGGYMHRVAELHPLLARR
jgi:hypothetical protein